MKGRLTSFQRFGSMVGVQGSALNKWPRGEEVRRDMDTAISSSPPTDKSGGKGIYNLTLTNNDNLYYTNTDPDMGEEVYGCISSGYTKNKASPTIEYSADVAIKNRRERKDYPADKDHFSGSGRIWAVGKNQESANVDSTCIPTENVPLVVNSKFAMKYWDEGEKKMIEVPKGAGFTSGALVRPIAFSDKAETSKYSNLKGVPIKTAHAILNRCKEITLKGSVDYSVKRSNKRCDGPTSSTMTWTSESGPSGCPPGYCTDTSGSTTITCISEKQTTTMGLSGSIDMTAYRYKQLSDIWDNPTSLDLSLNYFYGSVENGALLRKMSSSYCDPIESGFTDVPLPTVEIIAEYEKQTKLNSGCLVYPESNNSIMSATQEENLKTKTLTIKNCDPNSSATYYNLAVTPFDLYTIRYPDGVSRSYNWPYLAPSLHSGPSLGCRFSGNGWDFGELGSESPETYYTDNDCKDKGQNFRNYKMNWKSTGIKKTISGSCGLGFEGVDRYDRTQGKCECDSSCESCTTDHGELKLVCECQPMCNDQDYSGGFDEKPCKGERKEQCDAYWGFEFSIGKYVGVEIPVEEYVFDSVAPVPLSAKAETKTEDLNLFGGAYISEAEGLDLQQTYNHFGIPIYFSEPETRPDTSITRFESKQIGTLTLKCESWTSQIPLWTLFAISKATTCAGFSGDGGYNFILRSVTDIPSKGCNGCDGADYQSCCSPQGCSGYGYENPCCKSQLCGIDDPCGYAFNTTKFGKECAGNALITCAGSCQPRDDDCGCCGCGEEPYCEVICPPYISCAPYELIKGFDALGCYGDAHEEDTHEASVNLTLEFKLFTEME